ncbi:sulfatase [Pedosphaera parvula Ellin514]|uniref:Sulfatase n=2 Tax=Pedosphaera TaxID=1032526 RepID=B9XEU8_PEDPL|nr:sulfatase [Pedosphaera parvula Ellin514]
MLLTLTLPIRAAETNSQPNIVFILVDDIRWDAFGCMGHPFVKTPNIDRIAKEGALFKNFFVTLPLCSPSRGSFLTGQYAHVNGVTNNGEHSTLSHQLVTFPRLLHDAGYETSFVGKWHMGTDDTPRPGFDHWLSFKGQGVYENPNLNIDGKVSRVEGYITDILNSRAVEFVKQEHKKPFCLYVGHKAVHGPFTPAERHKELYTKEQIPHPPSIDDDLAGKPVLTRKEQQGPKDGQKPQKVGFDDEAERPMGKVPERLVRQQLRTLMAIDEGVGQLLRALEESRQLENTVIIFTSDNGYFWGEHHLGDKRWAYEESIRDPLLIRYPKLIKPGTVRDQMVLNIDIAPTLLELAHAPVSRSMQGRSLVPLFNKDSVEWRKSALFEYFQEKAYPRTPTWQAIRTEQWKYIHYTELEGMDELYNLKADSYEMKNLIKEQSARSSLQELKSELGKLLKQTSN